MYMQAAVKRWDSALGAARGVFAEMDEKYLIAALPIKELFDAQSVTIVAGGREMPAAAAGRALFEEIAKMDVKVRTHVEFLHFGHRSELGFSPNTPLVLFLSENGEDALCLASIDYANKSGANTLLIADCPQASAAKRARHGLFFSACGAQTAARHTAFIGALTVLALRFARAKSLLSARETEERVRQVYSNTDAWEKFLPQAQRWACDGAKEFRGVKAIDLIADYGDLSTASAGRAYIESAAGIRAYCGDSENWFHARRPLAGPSAVGRLVIANKSGLSFDRALEAIAQAARLGSPCAAVGDGESGSFPEKCAVLRTPPAPYFWLEPMLQHLPLVLLAQAIAEINGQGAAV